MNPAPRLRSALVLAAVLAFVSTARAEAANAVVFMYHHFGEPAYPSTSVRIGQFEAHLRHLEEGGYRILPLEEIVRRLRSGETLPDRSVALTMDDAYRSVYTEAYPRLRARGWPFTVFVATDAIDQGLPAYMSWEQMREMRRHGARFANHSASHDSLIRMRPEEDDGTWRERVSADIDRAQHRLEEELGPTPRLFAYPYGEYNTALAGLLEALGYVAFGQHSGAIGPLSDLRALPRFPMAEAYADIDDFRAKAASLALPVLEVQPWDPVIRGPTPPLMRVTLADSDARLSELSCYASYAGRIAVHWIGRGGTAFETRAGQPLPLGRSRYNCTAPSARSGRYFWFSHLWIRLPATERTPSEGRVPATRPNPAP